MSSEMAIINKKPCDTEGETSQLNGQECLELIEMCSPLSAIAKSPYEWKILERTQNVKLTIGGGV